MMRLLGALALVLSCSIATAQPLTFKDKTITLIVPSASGGGTDSTARVVAAALPAELPGTPAIVVRNIPGADGTIAMNYFVQQVASDGLTLAIGTSIQSDPTHYRNTNSKYDPTKFRIIGGVGLGGTVVLARNDALARLRDPKAQPVVMGSLGGVPRSGIQAAAWGIGFLGWNAKWVTGYRGTGDIILALERGEVDMMSTANLKTISRLVATGNFTILSQSGSLENGVVTRRPDFGDAPLLADLMRDSLKDAAVRKAFEYWTSLTSLDKWLALPGGTPQAIVDLYRASFARAAKTQAFIDGGRRVSEDFETTDVAAVEQFLQTLGAADPDARGFMNGLLRKQGLKIE